MLGGCLLGVFGILPLCYAPLGKPIVLLGIIFLEFLLLHVGQILSARLFLKLVKRGRRA